MVFYFYISYSLFATNKHKRPPMKVETPYMTFITYSGKINASTITENNNGNNPMIHKIKAFPSESLYFTIIYTFQKYFSQF